MKKQKYLTVRLDEKIHKKLKLMAFNSDIPMQKIGEKALSEWMQREKEKKDDSEG